MDVITYIHGLQQWMYPPRCVLCGGRGMVKGHSAVDMCQFCYQRLPGNQIACARCALPLPPDLANDGELLCGRCQKSPPIFDYSVSLFRYQQPVVWLVTQLKFNERLAHARLLGEMLAEKVMLLPDQKDKCDHIHFKVLPECILPVPLHKKRLVKRGFNQSIELARPVVRKTGIALELNLIERVLETEPQTGLDAAQRKKNLRGAFKIKHAIKYNHVAIVDDVVTTGSTVNELAKALKKAGVKRVDVWSIARAL